MYTPKRKRNQAGPKGNQVAGVLWCWGEPLGLQAAQRMCPAADGAVGAWGKGRAGAGMRVFLYLCEPFQRFKSFHFLTSLEPQPITGRTDAIIFHVTDEKTGTLRRAHAAPPNLPFKLGLRKVRGSDRGLKSVPTRLHGTSEWQLIWN